MYSLEDLKETFTFLKNSFVDDMQGCYSLDSKVAGPCVGITILTHGNEPTGLAALKYFLDNRILPHKGRIIFVLNNIQAGENYFQAVDEKEKKKCRYVDINFNRLPFECLEMQSDEYEIKRIKELYPIYRKFDFGLDIHSTKANPKAMIVNVGDDLSYELFAGFPDEIEDVIFNITKIQRGIPASALFGGKEREIPRLVIESGKHEDGSSFKTAIECTLEFCRNCGVLPPSAKERKKGNYKIYKVVKSVFFQDSSFETPRDFEAFERLTEETVLGVNRDGDKIFSPVKGLTLFGSAKDYKPKTVDDEVFFITEEPYVINI
ncbi:MAG TPA: hypothetical protein VF721_09565 [Pyrinomonadaceae bacterium]|jgi:hypothetical protein